MELLVQQLVAGLSSGAIYASVALALVVIYAATGHLNFAQGEMAMVSCFVAWQLMQWGCPYWPAFALTVVASFVGGALIDLTILRPLRDAPGLSQVAVSIGLLSVLHSLAGFVWGPELRTFPMPFGSGGLLGTALIGTHQAATLAVTCLVMALLFLLLRFTGIGLAMRAAAMNAASSRLVGIRVGRMVALGWGISAAIGAVAGMLVAPTVFLDPNMMLGPLLYGFVAAVLGGLASPAGAVLGGLLVGVAENLAGTYIPVVGAELKLPIALCLIVVVLVFRPTGLLRRSIVQRV